MMLRTFMCLLGICQVAVAADLKTPFDFESAAVLPQGVRNPRFKNLITFMDEKFGPNGGSEALGYKLNKNVSWQDVLDGIDDPAKKAELAGKIQTMGFNANETAGATAGVVNTYANVKVPVFAMGVTDRLTLAVAVPIVSVDVNADTGFSKSTQAQALVDDTVNNGNPVAASEAAKSFNDAINSKLRRLGYDEIKSTHQTSIGDVKVVGKYLVASRRDDAFSVKSDLTLPTGTPPNANKALDVPTGDGAFSVGATAIYDRFLDRNHSWRSNVYGGYTAQLADHIEKRIPESESETLSRDKEVLSRNRGDVISAGTGVTYEFPFGLNLGAAYGFQFMNKTSYGRGQFEETRYRVLEQNTLELMHSATLGVGFSSVEMYKSKRFAAPFQVNVAYCKVLAGINVVRNDLLAMEVVLFF